jgi:hypothetical protein
MSICEKPVVVNIGECPGWETDEVEVKRVV